MHLILFYCSKIIHYCIRFFSFVENAIKSEIWVMLISLCKYRLIGLQRYIIRFLLFIIIRFNANYII